MQVDPNSSFGTIDQIMGSGYEFIVEGASFTPGGDFFLDPATPGGITQVRPTTEGQMLQRVGRAGLDGQTVFVQLDEAYILPASGGPYAAASDLGDLGSLDTTAKSSAVAAINELDTDIGALSALTTTAKSSAVAAINEVDGIAKTAVQPGALAATALKIKAGQATVVLAAGTLAVTLTGYGTSYLFIGSIISGPNGALLRVTQNSASAALAIVNASGVAIDCSSTNCVVNWVAIATA